VVHTAEAVIKKDERRNISEGLRFAIIEAQVAWAKGKGERRGRKEGTKKEEGGRRGGELTLRRFFDNL